MVHKISKKSNSSAVGITMAEKADITWIWRQGPVHTVQIRTGWIGEAG